MKPAAPAGSRAGLALALLCLAAPARADELCTSWYAAHERCHDAHATGDDASCCEGSDIQASCQCASATGWWDNRRLSAVDEPRRLGHCCDYGAYCSCMESELGAGCAAPDDECGEDGDEDEDWYEDWMWDGGCRPDYCTSWGEDCCASMNWGEPATCANGYSPQPPSPNDDCQYTCCPASVTVSGSVTLYEDKSRGAGCDALSRINNVVDADSADHCCQDEPYCCDFGSCAPDSDYCGHRFHCPEFLVTGDLTFEGITYEAAQDNTDVFVAAVADLCGVAASAVTVEISRARRRRLAEGIVVTYTVGVATANEAQTVTSAISSSSTADVDAAISKAATDAGVDDDFDGVTTTNVGTPTSCDPSSMDYVAVSGRGCGDYIHMDDGWYGDRWLSGGSTSLEDCAAAVRAYDGQNGCRGTYFFYETGGYCNCPTDDCGLGYETVNAGGPGQLYQYGCGVVDVDPTWYYSKWPDDCQHGGGGDDVCRAFRTQDDCINYCYQDDDDEQCEDVDDPEDCNWSIVTHVNAVAGWSTFFAGLVLFPTLVWVALLFLVPDPQAAAPVTAVELPRMQPQVMMVSPVSAGEGQPQVIMGQPQIVQAGQAPVIMGQPQIVQAGQAPVIMGQPQVVQGGQPPVIMGQPQVVQGAPSKLAEF